LRDELILFLVYLFLSSILLSFFLKPQDNYRQATAADNSFFSGPAFVTHPADTFPVFFSPHKITAFFFLMLGVRSFRYFSSLPQI